MREGFISAVALGSFVRPFDRLHRREAGLLCVCMVYVIGGAVSNVVQASQVDLTILAAVQYLMVAFWVILTAAAIRFAVVSGADVSRYGLSGGVVSWTTVIFCSAYTIYAFTSRSSILVPPLLGTWLGLFGVVVEEVVFRVILVHLFRKLLGPLNHSLFYSILLSSLIWSSVHIPTKDFSLVIGLFITAILVSTFYWYTRSLLLPIWLHALANTGFVGAGVAVVLYTAVLVVLRFTRHRNKVAQMS